MKQLMVILFSCVISIQQINAQYNRIDKHYDTYLKKVFDPTFQKERTSKKKYKKIIYGNLVETKKSIQINPNETFVISSNTSNDKLLAAILYGIKYHSTYKFMADDYGQSHHVNEYNMKEYLRIEIHELPDTNTMYLKKNTRINSIEKIQHYSVNKKVRLSHPIIINYYTNHYENQNGWHKNIKTVIKQNDKIIYSSQQNDQRVVINHADLLNKHHFVYDHNNKQILSTGGLQQYILHHYLKNIKEKIHLEATEIRNVSDFYAHQNKGLKRIYDRGSLQNKAPFSKDFLGINTMEY